MRETIFLSLLLTFTQFAHAGSGSGEITQIMVHQNGGNGNGTIIFKTPNNTNKAACSVSPDGWAFSLDTEAGRAMYELLLLAKEKQYSVSISGSGDCDAWADRERPNVIHITD